MRSKGGERGAGDLKSEGPGILGYDNSWVSRRTEVRRKDLLLVAYVD